MFQQLPTVIARERGVFLLGGFYFFFYLFLFHSQQHFFQLFFSCSHAQHRETLTVQQSVKSHAQGCGTPASASMPAMGSAAFCPLSYCNVRQIIVTKNIISSRKGGSATDKPNGGLFAAAKDHC